MAGEVTASQVVGKVKGDISDLKNKYKEAKQETSGLSSFLKSSLSTAFGFLTGSLVQSGLNDLIGGFKDLIGTGINVNEEFQNLHAQLTAITGSSGSATKILDWVKQFGQDVPDTTEHLAEATVAIQSLGVNATKVMPYLANVAAAMHVDLPTAAQAFSDAFEGRFQMLQMTLHITKSQLEQFGLQVDKNGKVLNNSFLPAFEKLSQAKFGKGTAEAMTTFSGQLSNLTDRWQFFTAALTKPLFDLAQQGLKDFFGFLDQHKDLINTIATTIGTTLANGIKDAGNFLQTLKDDFAKAFDDKNGQKVAKLKDLAGDLLTGLKNLGNWLKDHLEGALEGIAGALGNVASWISQTKQHIQDIQVWWQQWGFLIETAGLMITTFFLPALIKAGLQSVISSEQIAQNFVLSLIKSGKEAFIAAAKLWMDPGSFFQGLVKTGEAAKANAAKVDAMAASEEGVGEKAAASTELETMATAEQAVGDEAEGSIAKVDGLAASEDTLGKASTTAAGSAGAGGLGGLGVLGLLAAVVGFGDYITMKVPSDWISSHIVDFLNNIGKNANDAAGGVQNLTTQLPKLASQFTDLTPLMKFNDDMLGLGTTLQNDYLNTLSLADALHRLNMQEYSYMTGNGYGSNDNPNNGTHHPHAMGGFVGPNEMLSLINDQGGRGELVHLPSGSYVYPHDQSVTMLQQMGAGNSTELLAEMRAIRTLLASGAATPQVFSGVIDPTEYRKMQTLSAQRNQALYGRR